MQYLLLYMVLAHVIGDFYLQWNGFCEQKRNEYWYGWHKIVHGIVIFVITWLFTFAMDGWWLAATIAILHWGIDTLKAVAENNIKTPEIDSLGNRKYLKDSRFVLLSFVADQILHAVVICMVCTIWLKSNDVYVFDWLRTDFVMKIALFTVLAIIAHKPVNIFVTLLLRFCQVPIRTEATPQPQATTDHVVTDNATDDHGNFRSGALIGTLERLLMMSFVILGQYEAIGFLIAAKSILRFSETSKGSEKAEYVLTGTFISMAIALLFGVLVVKKDVIF